MSGNDTAPAWHGTTILSVRKSGKVVIAGDGQVTAGQTVMKPNARKVRPLGDGSVIAGFATANGQGFAVRWVDGGAAESLGDLAGGNVAPQSHAVSGDGSAIVGQAGSAAALTEAFLWTSGGGMVGLGFLPGDSRSVAQDVSLAGGSVVGQSSGASGDTAFLWTPEHGMRSLLDVLQDDYGLDLSGWRLLAAEGISDDGRVIVGDGIDPDGNYVPWVATIPEPSTALLLGLGVAALAGTRPRRSRSTR
jgi:uncharacterized membrane protein